jgi:TRAP-type uncharacterized transport system substrate-binding protein
MLDSEPEWKQLVDIQPDGAATALNKVLDKNLRVFVVMDGPNSPLLEQVRTTMDQKTKKQAFKFIDFRPNNKMLKKVLSNGSPVYGTATLQSGWFRDVRTVATPAVLAVRQDYYNNNASAVNKIRAAAEDAKPKIAADTGAKPNWADAFTP